MDNQLILPGGSERLPHEEFVRTLDLIRETNAPAYTNMKLTISRVAAMVLVQDTEEAYYRQDTRQFHIFELARDQISGFSKYLHIPAHEARYTLMIRKGSEFAAVFVSDLTTGFIYVRKYLRSVRIILDLLDTFTPYLRPVEPAGRSREGGENSDTRSA